MDATIQTANAKTVTVVATALAEPKFNHQKEAVTTVSFFY